MPIVTLNTKLGDIFRLTDTQKSAARKLALETVDDLLRYLPARYINASNLKSIAEIVVGENIAIEGKVTFLDAKKTFKKRLSTIPNRETTSKKRGEWPTKVEKDHRMP